MTYTAEKYNVTGMTCASCSAHVQKAVSAVNGVENASVNLLTGVMEVEGNVSADSVIQAVRNAGYDAVYASNGKTQTVSEPVPADAETASFVKRLVLSVIFLLPLLYVSMGAMLWNWPLPPLFARNPAAHGLYELILSAVILVINQKFFVSGFKSLAHRAPNMDSLVSIGAAASFLYSVYQLFAVILELPESSHDFYFESAAMILTLITAGKTLESYSKGRTTDAIRALMELAPKTACVLRNGKEVTVSVSDVQKGDTFVVRPGSAVPADGVVTEGSAAVDESSLTGESVPSEKTAGSQVFAGTINKSGIITCRAEKTGEGTTLSQIIQLVGNTAASKVPAARVADKVSLVFVPAVMAAAAVVFAVWLIAGQTVQFALFRAVAVLVISCPCALGLAVPVAVMAGSGSGSKCGILFKNGEAMENAGRAGTVILDKTGTVTTGVMSVYKVYAEQGTAENELVEQAASLEQGSSHPAARALVLYAREKHLRLFPVSDFNEIAGKGVRAVCGGKKLLGGNAAFMKENGISVPVYAESGTVLYFASDGKFTGTVIVSDTIKPDSEAAVRMFRKLGCRVLLLTGDNEKTARYIAAQAGITDVIAGVFPGGKADAVKEEKKNGAVIMIGDGINDAPALTASDAGIALGSGTDIAMDAAGIVITGGSLIRAADAVRLSRAVLRNIHENLFWALFYNVLCIPLAAGAWYPLFGITLNPMVCAAAMGLSSFCVVTNALRLNLFHPSAAADCVIHCNSNGGKKDMKKTVTIKGMMCAHCQAHVKEALEGINGVKADVDFKKGTAVVTGTDVTDDAIKAAVTKAGYEVTAVQ